MEFLKLYKRVFVFKNSCETHINTMFTLLVVTYQGTGVEILSFFLFVFWFNLWGFFQVLEVVIFGIL